MPSSSHTNSPPDRATSTRTATSGGGRKTPSTHRPSPRLFPHSPRLHPHSPQPSPRLHPHTPPQRMVNTVPPWARDEDPSSPTGSIAVSPILDPSGPPPLSTIPPLSLSGSPPDEPASMSLTTTHSGPGRPSIDTSWWTFVSPRPTTSPSVRAAAAPRPQQHVPEFALDDSEVDATAAEKGEGTKQRSGHRASISTFFPRATIHRRMTMPAPTQGPPNSNPASPGTVLRSLAYPALAEPGAAPAEKAPRPDSSRPASLHLDLSHPPDALPPHTLRQTQTPGWDTPWRPSHEFVWVNRAGAGSRSGSGGPGGEGPEPLRTAGMSSDSGGGGGDEVWNRKKKRWRNFCLYHSSTPLLFRFLNLTFTVAALALGIHARLSEEAEGVEGVLGSSPAVVIVFSPLTLIHVVVAIYLEYFGRPLGLWRTSAKLTYTLLDVVFVCLWSSALSLSIDNYLTTPIRCAPRRLTSWWSDQQTEPPNPLAGQDPALDLGLCRDQLAIIFLVLVGLCSYCTNLVISLFRIFEKVKYRSLEPYGA